MAKTTTQEKKKRQVSRKTPKTEDVSVKCSEWCAAGERESYKQSGCAGGFYPECKGNKRWFSCTASRV